MAELGLGQPAIAWHTMRDGFAEVGCFLGLVSGTLGKLAIDMKLMMQTEVEEVFEPFADGRGSSSTMPQKRNPISCNYIHRQHIGGAAARGGPARRDGRGPRALHRPWEIEWIVMPEIFLLCRRRAASSALRVDGLESIRRACAPIST